MKKTETTKTRKKAIPKSKKNSEKDVENLDQLEPRGFCVGIGASAGGLEALEQFFKNMPHDTGLSFVVVQHLSPDYKSLMVELLSKHTQMTVYRAEDGMNILPNCIYLIPPKKNMTVFHGNLFLTEQDHHHVINLPIDIFLRSLAEDYADKSIGIILSGTGSDGTLGIRAIKGIGGMVMAQDDSSAKFDGMPKSAIATGLVDYILPADKMPEELLKYVKHPLTSKGEDKQNISGPESTLGKIMSLIRGTTGVDFTYYKPNTIIRRLERRISINQISTYENYVSFLENSEKEINILYKELLIGVTRFFRDQESFDILQDHVIPAIFKEKSIDEPVRLWSVGCSTGEEAYSLAILIKEHMDKIGKNHDIKIFATDLDKESIEYGSMGFYTESIVADVSGERLKNFFIKKDKGYQIKESIRKMVIFATHNIIKDPPFSKIDLISCRNMLIYLKPVMQKKVLSLFHFSLNKKGYLFLGSSESLGDLSKSFTTINSKWKIYSYKESYSNDILGDMILPTISTGKGNTVLPDIPVRTANKNQNEITENFYNTIIEEFIPPSVIIDENFEIVHIYKDVNKYIKLPAGKITFDILSLVRKELSTTISISVHKALKENKEVIYNDFKLKDENEIWHLNIKVKPLKEKVRSKRLIFIFFEEIEKVKVSESKQNEEVIEYDTSQQIKDLELELKYTKENLQATIEELGTSNEELQATNEELISSNEELQSTNEELQSVNEELYTVNSEYQNKIDVLTQLNNDINNLLKNTNIGTVFLDRNLLIRKFTPAVTSAINILEMDIGRPIHHISHNTSYENFLEDIETVLRTLVPREVEVQGKKNNWFLMRILPYRTLENAIDGVVITFFDITERKIFEEEIERKSKLLISVLDNSPIASTILDDKGRITYANHLAEKVLGITKDEILSREHNADTWRITDESGNPFPDEKLPFALIKKSGKPVFNIIHNIEWPNGTVKTLSINGSPIFDEKQQVDGIVCTLEDITEKRIMEEKLIREHNLFIRILENSHNAQLLTDENGIITFSNHLTADLLNYEKKDNLLGMSFTDLNISPSENMGEYKNVIDKVIKTGSTLLNIRHNLVKEDNNTEILHITASPAFNESKKVEGVVISIDNHNDIIINSELMEEQVKILSNKIDKAVFSIDLSGTVLSWNRKAEDITEVKSCSILGKKCFSMENGESKQNKVPCFIQESATKKSFCKKIFIETKKKDIQLQADDIEVVFNKKKQVIGALFYIEKLL